MNIEDQACSLQLSKKLKELGVKQDSLFYYCEFDEAYAIGYLEDFKHTGKNKICSAFTCAEIGELLPTRINIEMHTNSEGKEERVPLSFRLKITKITLVDESSNVHYSWSINYASDIVQGIKSYMQDFIFPELSIESINDSNEANARAKMLIFLIENGHISRMDI